MARILIPDTPVDLVSTNVDDSDLDEWAAYTAYSTGDEVKLTLDPLEQPLPLPHREYRARIDHTSSADAPPKSGGNAEWIDIGATNQHRMFDGLNNTPTVVDADDDDIVVQVNLNGRRQVLSLMGLKNVSEVIVEQKVDGIVVHSESLDTTRHRRGPGWWTWLFGQDEKTFTKSITYRLKGNYKTQTLTLTLKKNRRGGGPAECSQCLISSEIDLGCTLEGATPRIKKWSTFRANEAGEYTFVPRKGTRTGSYTLVMDTNYVDTVYGIVEDLEEKLVLLDANNENTSFDSIRAYGNIIDFSPSLAYNKTRVDIKIEGIN
jgi:hypothetical protein